MKTMHQPSNLVRRVDIYRTCVDTSWNPQLVHVGVDCRPLRRLDIHHELVRMCGSFPASLAHCGHSLMSFAQGCAETGRSVFIHWQREGCAAHSIEHRKDNRHRFPRALWKEPYVHMGYYWAQGEWEHQVQFFASFGEERGMYFLEDAYCSWGFTQ